MGATGFDWLAQAGAQNAERQSAAKQQLSNDQRHSLIAQNQAASLGISHVLTTGIHPDTGAPLTAGDRIQLAQKNKELQAQLQDLWNPRQDPNKLGKAQSVASGVNQPPGLVRKATDALHITKPAAPGTPQTTTTQTPETKVGDITLPAGQPVTVNGPPKSPQQQVQELREITQRYQPQPGQEQAQSADALLQGKLQSINADPNLTADEKGEARRKVYGVGEKPNLKLYTLPDGTRGWFDAARPETIPEGSSAVGATDTSDTRARADFQAFQKDHPEYKGTFEQWKTEEAGKGRAAAPKPETLDKQYQDILVKKAAGRPLSPDEKAHESAWKLWNQEKNIDPGVARAAAFGASRYIMVLDPKDPEKVIPMRAGDAAKAGVGTPQGIAFQIDKAVTKAFTTGKPADTINYFNTATDHLNILREAADALNNGDTQMFNKVANSFATATGNPAPTNFDTVRNAVAGELAKTFKGAGASDEEISLITGTINNAQSPDQLHGAIDYDLKLMAGKISALKGQYEQGKTGKPNFPSDVDDIIKALKKK